MRDVDVHLTSEAKPLLTWLLIGPITAVILVFVAAGATRAAQPVTAENFASAESDLYFSNIVKDGGAESLFTGGNRPISTPIR
jgi:hypothetical protein